MAGLGGGRRDREGPRTDVTRERAALRAQLDAVAEEKQRALEDPGPSWHDWWYFSASKWYVLIGFLILDVWVGGFWVEAGYGAVALASVVALLYGEFLLYEYLWRRPALPERGRAPPFRRTWWRPVEVGRWTPEAAARARTGALPGEDDAPDLHEFV